MKLCSIASGSSGNCIYVGSQNTHLIVDAGISGRRIEEGLNEIGLTTREMDGILITHEHSDHVSGLGVLARKHGIPIYATKGTIQAILGMKTLGKMDEGLFREIEADREFSLGDVEISPVAISHDAAQPVSYILRQKDKSIGIITDLGKYDQYIIERFQGLNVLLLEANHDIHMLQVGNYPYYLKQRILGDRGHLSNELSGQLLGQLLHDRFKTVLLGHLSKENNYEKLAYETVRLEVAMGDNPYKGDDFPIYVAKRDSVSQIIEA
ncbi:MAG: MBL fold metallo-hydrolase [Lachnospiraceae bacterium]|jgi:phosphoribosyl 1,2-cyclic phosphodiesterase|nr:MBL fold metallo-hydrolase [Lachnospiraceae bacterium]